MTLTESQCREYAGQWKHDLLVRLSVVIQVKYQYNKPNNRKIIFRYRGVVASKVRL